MYVFEVGGGFGAGMLINVIDWHFRQHSLGLLFGLPTGRLGTVGPEGFESDEILFVFGYLCCRFWRGRHKPYVCLLRGHGRQA